MGLPLGPQSRLLVVILAALSAYPINAFGVSDNKAYVGALTGVSFPSSSSFVFAYGISGAYQFKPQISFGLSYHAYSVSGALSSSGQTADFSAKSRFYTGYVEYLFDSQLRGFSAGVKTGLMSISGDANATNGSSNVDFSNLNNYFFLGPKIGYDQFYGRLSIGAEVSDVFGIGDGAPSVFSVMANGKIWF